MQTNTIETPPAEVTGNHDDHEYDALRARIQQRFLDAVKGGTEPLFTTDAVGLWEAYYAAFPAATAQYHNCYACQAFIRKYGSLVTIDKKGHTRSALWDEDENDPVHRAGIVAMARIVERARVTGTFLETEQDWGQPVTGKWTHFCVRPPASMLHTSKTQSAHQAMAEKRQDFANVSYALSDFGPDLVAEACRVLDADVLYRSEKVAGAAHFLRDLWTSLRQGGSRTVLLGRENQSLIGGSVGRNLIWRAVAKAPAGHCHPRSSMVGTLLEDLAAGKSFDEVSEAFAAKMRPDKYLRPQAAPAAGTIDQAEKLIDQLGARRSLERRFARLDELQTFWQPAPTRETEQPAGVFGHIRPKEAAPVRAPLELPAQVSTWKKFSASVLPSATALEISVPHHGPFVAFTTAVHADAPPILRWDASETRNPVSWYSYINGSVARQWGLVPTRWAAVSGLTLAPSAWADTSRAKAAFALIVGAVDSRDEGNALFPETLRDELHAVRSVIEAYSRTAKLLGREEASACGLPCVGASLRVTDASGAKTVYRIDRWE